MRRFLIATFLIIMIPTQAFSAVGFFSLLPNPVGKDEDGEYIELRNIGCEVVDISGFSLSDASGKVYVFPTWTSIASHENGKYTYSETKIALNNSGNESIYLKDAGWNIMSETQYSGTQKDGAVIILSPMDENCMPYEIEEERGGSETDSWSTVYTGGVLEEDVLIESTNSGGTESGGTLSDTWNIVDIPSYDAVVWWSGLLVSTTGSALDDIEFLSWSEEENGWVISEISQTHTESGLVNTGELVSYVETGILLPIEMYYSDMNRNNKIDMLEIYYPYNLTGTIHTGSIQLYSNTWWLSYARIDSQTGYILSGSLSWNILILELHEGDIEKVWLKITNTPSSELRLKSVWDLGFRSIGGQMPESFFLTKSFDEYKRVWQKIEKTGIESEQAKTDSGIVVFPEIIPTFQNYTNTTDSWDVLICTMVPCRLNFTLEPIFTWWFLQKDFSCQVSFGTGIYDTCNPPQLYPTASGAILLILTHKATGTSTGRLFTIVMNILSSKSTWGVVGIGIPPTNHPPVASIDMDGKWKTYFTSPEVNLLRCYAFTCSVNFTGENSYDPDNDDIQYFWLYDYQETSTKKDPWIRIFGIGNHTVILRVTDIYGASSETKYKIEVIHPDYIPEDEVEKKEKVAKWKSIKNKKTKAEKVVEKKKKKMKPVVFFDIPELVVQNKNPDNIEVSGNRYSCYTKTKTCSINFTLTGTQKWYTYEWIFPNQNGGYISKNPRSFAFPVGDSDLHIIIRDLAGNILTEQDIQIHVIKTTKTRIKKTPTTHRDEEEESEKEQEAPIRIFTNEEQQESENSSLFFLLFLSSSWFSGYLAIRRKRAW